MVAHEGMSRRVYGAAKTVGAKVFRCKWSVAPMLIALSVCATAEPVSQMLPQDALIKGFARWQANRVEKIILDEAIRNISRDPYIERFFPQTAKNVQAYEGISGKRLVPLMQHYIQRDVTLLGSIVMSCIPYSINSWMFVPVNEQGLAKQAQEAQALFAQLSRLLSKPVADDGWTVEGFRDAVCKDANLTLPIPIKHLSRPNLKQVVDAIANYVRSPAGIAGISALTAEMPDLPDRLEKFLNADYLLQLGAALEEFQTTVEKTDSYAVRIHVLVQAIEQFGGMSEKDYPGFSKLRDTSLFFAGLADAAKAGDPDGVVAVLNAYVDDEDAYRRKRVDRSYRSLVRVPRYDATARQVRATNYIYHCRRAGVFPCRGTLFVSSYYGASFIQMADEAGGSKDWHARAFGPVGIELKLMTWRSAPLTVNFAPIDIGNYVTNELNGKDYSAKFDDILAPSVFFAYSFRSKPFAVLLGYQKNIRVAEDVETEGPFLSLAFDLPIFTLY